MAAPSPRTPATSTTGNNQTTLALTVPSGTVEGDLLVAAVGVADSSTLTMTGWTVVTGVDSYVYFVCQSIFWKAATADDEANAGTKTYTVTSSVSTRWAAGMVAISGADTVAPVDVSGVTEDSFDSTANLTGVTTTVADTLLLAHYTSDSTRTLSGTPGTELWDIQRGGAGTDITSVLTHEAQTSAGATGDKNGTWDGNSRAPNALVAIKPAAGGGTTISGSQATETDTANGGTPVGGTVTVSFTSSGTDDGDVAATGATYPPGGTPAANDTGDTITAARRLAFGDFGIFVALVRFDTSTLPDGATVESATLKLRSSVVNNADSRNVTVEWYDPSNWPIDTGDYTATAAAGGATVPVADFVAGTVEEIPLSNLAVSLTGYTGFRIHVDGGEPAGDNLVQWASEEDATLAGPELVVTYIVTSDVTGTQAAETSTANAGTAVVSVAGSQASETSTVGSGSPWEPPTAVPAGRSLAAANRWHNADGNLHKSSTDGGATWSAGVNPGGSTFPLQYHGLHAAGDVVHLLSPTADMGGADQPVNYFRSDDNGATWSSAVEVTDTAGGVEAHRCYITGVGDNVYVLFHTFISAGTQDVWLRRSTDAGLTWEPLVQLGVADGMGAGIGADPSTGTVLVIYSKFQGGVEKSVVRRSTDDGASWSAEQFIGGPTVAGDTEQARPRVAGDGGYWVATWEGNTSAGPVRPISGNRSADDGVSWSGVEDFIDTGTELNHQSMAKVGPVVHLACVDGNPTSGNRHIYRFSLDHGASWSAVETVNLSTDNVTWMLRADSSWVLLTNAEDELVRRPAVQASDTAVGGSGAAESDSAQAGTAVATVAGSGASETSTAAGGTAAVSVVGQQATETSTANSGTAAVVVAGQQATESDTGQAGTATVLIAGSQASETDVATAGALTVALVGVGATETDSGQSGSVVGGNTVNGSTATEASTANAGSAAVTVAGGQVSETDVAGSGSTTTTVIVAGNTATETATTTAGTAAVVVYGTGATETDTARSGAASGGLYTTAPADRTVTVTAEPRTLTVPAEARTLEVAR